MRVLNKLDRYHLILSALDYIDVPNEDEIVAYCNKKLKEHKTYIKKYGVDMKEIREWRFQ